MIGENSLNDEEQSMLLLLYYIGEPITPNKRFQKSFFLASGEISKYFPSVQFRPEEVSMGPYSPAITSILDSLCFKGYAQFNMSLTSIGGPHSVYTLTSSGSLLATRLKDREELRHASRFYTEGDTSSICQDAIKKYSATLPNMRENNIKSVSVASTSVMFDPSTEEELESRAHKLVSGLDSRFKIESTVGGMQKIESRKFVPLTAKIDGSIFYSDLTGSDYFGSPLFKEFLNRTCEHEFYAYLYEDSGLLIYYSHSGFPVDRGADSEFSPLVTSQHFANLCKRIVTSLHLSMFSLYNPGFASRFGSKGITYVE
jgi:hypothetical protein